jgi:hypothetical protein
MPLKTNSKIMVSKKVNKFRLIKKAISKKLILRSEFMRIRKERL